MPKLTKICLILYYPDCSTGPATIIALAAGTCSASLQFHSRRKIIYPRNFSPHHPVCVLTSIDSCLPPPHYSESTIAFAFFTCLPHLDVSQVPTSRVHPWHAAQGYFVSPILLSHPPPTMESAAAKVLVTDMRPMSFSSTRHRWGGGLVGHSK